MAALTWMIFRGFTTPAAAATLTAAGLTSGLLLFAVRSHTRLNIKLNRVQRLATNAVGEISALRDESECRWLMQDLWENHKSTADMLFSPPDDASRG